MIHNYAAFVETYDDKEEAIASLTCEGTRYGVYFVLTAASTSAVRFRILQNIKQIFVLQLNDASEYTSLLGHIGGVQPSPFEGRGIYKSDVVYEFQTARTSKAARNEMVAIRERCAKLAEAWSGPAARRIPILPARVTLSTLLDEATCPDLRAVPIGIDAPRVA